MLNIKHLDSKFKKNNQKKQHTDMFIKSLQTQAPEKMFLNSCFPMKKSIVSGAARDPDLS